MATRFHALAILGITALLTSGCSMMPFGRDEPVSRAPAPLAAAPTGSVTGTLLPPPGRHDAAAADRRPGWPRSTRRRRRPLPPRLPAAPGVEVGRTDLLGGWTISAAGNSCQLFMTLTTWAGGYRASTRGCSSAPLQTISAWNMEGRQMQLLNDSGATVARLYPSSRTEFTGQTEGGGPVTVIR